jgi:hypothetical protein
MMMSDQVLRERAEAYPSIITYCNQPEQVDAMTPHWAIKTAVGAVIAAFVNLAIQR